jgi:50S ribosomal subunit-associated GTPase HflX
MQKVIIVDIAPKDTDVDSLNERLSEVENLVNTYGSLVVVKKIQKRDIPDYNTYV